MAYDKEKIEKEILKAIEEEELTFFSEVPLFVSPARSTLYELELDKSDKIKELLSANKLKLKNKMRRKWRESDNATLQISAYKLLADDDELKRLTVNKAEVSGPNGESLPQPQTGIFIGVDYSKLPPNVLDSILEARITNGE